MPVIGILLSIGIYSNAGSGSLNLGVLNKDNSVIASDMVRSLSKESRFKITPVNEKDIKNAVATGKTDCVLVIPRGFGDGIRNSHWQQVEVISIKSQTATAWVSSYLNTYTRNLLDIAEASGGNKDIFNKIYGNFNQEKRMLKVSQVQDRTKSRV